MIQTGTQILSYKIISLIGEGGMGTVYLAEHSSLGRKAAIKALLPEYAGNRQIRERFMNEAKTLSMLNHQNIVTLYDYNETEDNLFLIMEYAEGTSLDVLIERNPGGMHEARCINIFEQVLAGFSYAHKKGIIHRDIKPANILIQDDDSPKIVDFGIARIIEGDLRLTQAGTRMGSVLYMSPEQVTGKDVDLRSDIYSLGVTLYEMLSGRLPYDSAAESEFDIQTKIVRQPLPRIRSVNPNVSQNIENVIIKATEKDADSRFRNCDEFSQALKHGGLGFSAQKTVFQPSAMQQGKTVFVPAPQNRNNKILFFGIGAVVLVTVLILIYIFTQKDEADVEKITLQDDSKVEKVLPGSTGNDKDSKDNSKKQERRDYSTPGNYPDASTRYLSNSDVNNLSKWDLKIMRNEIFARHGYIFKTNEMSDYFNRQAWYDGKYDNVDNMLTDIEHANIKLIKKYE